MPKKEDAYPNKWTKGKKAWAHLNTVNPACVK